MKIKTVIKFAAIFWYVAAGAVAIAFLCNAPIPRALFAFSMGVLLYHCSREIRDWIRL